MTWLFGSSDARLTSPRFMKRIAIELVEVQASLPPSSTTSWKKMWLSRRVGDILSLNDAPLWRRLDEVISGYQVSTKGCLILDASRLQKYEQQALWIDICDQELT